jgi:hypothetical protein
VLGVDHESRFVCNGREFGRVTNPLPRRAQAVQAQPASCQACKGTGRSLDSQFVCHRCGAQPASHNPRVLALVNGAAYALNPTSQTEKPNVAKAHGYLCEAVDLLMREAQPASPERACLCYDDSNPSPCPVHLAETLSQEDIDWMNAPMGPRQPASARPDVEATVAAIVDQLDQRGVLKRGSAAQLAGERRHAEGIIREALSHAPVAQRLDDETLARCLVDAVLSAMTGHKHLSDGARLSRAADAVKAMLVRVPAPAASVELELLRELHTLVRGECPSLLSEDSGGDAALAIRILVALQGGARDTGAE